MFKTKLGQEENQARFGTPEEIRENSVRIDYVTGAASDSGVNIISDGKEAYAYADDGFYGVIGGTGSKKTRNIVTPYIYNNALAGNSMVITDVKGDVYKIMSRVLKKLGYKIVVLNFNEPEKGDAYNPMLPIYRDYKNGELAKANRELNNLGDMIFKTVKSEKDPFWENAAANYFAGCMLTAFDICKEDAISIDNAIDIHIQGSRTYKYSQTFFDKYYEEKSDSDAWKLLVSTVDAPAETKRSIHSVYLTALNKLMGQNDGLKKMLSHSTFEIDEIVDKKTAVFIISNEESLSVNGSLISGIINQWYDAFISIAEKTKGILERRVVFVLDEFGNLPALIDFQTTISLSRARGIFWMIVIQSSTQLIYRYGEYAAQTIIGNISNWIYLFLPDLVLVKNISELCGEIIDTNTGYSQPLLSVNQLRHLKKIDDDGNTEVLFILGRMHPYISALPDISKYDGIDIIEEFDIPIRKNKKKKNILFFKYIEKLLKERTSSKDIVYKNVSIIVPQEAARDETKVAKKKTGNSADKKRHKNVAD